jgi:predicted glycosyltransferase
MYYADLFIGESATMASESAVLGTPAIFVSTLQAGVLNEIEEKYGLLYMISENRKRQQVIRNTRDR